MSVHTTVTKPGIYFITFTCNQWLPLIQRDNGYDIIYNWFNILVEKGNSITGYVIMPNHVHLLLHYTGMAKSLNLVVGNGKRFMAYEIVKRPNSWMKKNYWKNCSFLFNLLTGTAARSMRYGEIPLM